MQKGTKNAAKLPESPLLKSQLRSRFKELFRERLSAGADSIKIPEQKLVQNILHFLESYSGIWGAYRALPSEATVDGVISARADIVWVFPKMSDQGLDFYKPTGWRQEARFGVLEPEPAEFSGGDHPDQVALEQIQGLLIPGLAFDSSGNRLGRGKGFYDKTLSSFPGVKVGIGFSWQVSPASIPTESHDVAMDFVITDEKITRHQKL